MQEVPPEDSSSNKEEEQIVKKTVTFEELEFNDPLLEALDVMGFKEATPVQAAAIPPIFQGKDIMAIAQTGTGKTAAFLLPVLDLIMYDEESEGKTTCLILTPTRELALQIDKQAEALGYYTGVGSVPIYGGGEGSGWDQQKKALTKGADIVVATPGRLISHLNMGYVKFGDIKYLILDEADRMMDMGFIGDIKKIDKHLPKEKQVLMFSATMPPNIRKLSKDLLRNPVNVNIAISKPAKNVMQIAYSVYEAQKNRLIVDLLKGKKNYKRIIVFSSTKKAVSGIVTALKTKGLQAEGISSDLEQKKREQVLRDFVNDKVQIIVATDVLSRGIDIKDISLVINYDVPPDPEDYIHRIGRTARAKASGIAITFISEKDQFRFGRIEKLLGEEIMKTPLPKELGEGPVYNPPKKKPKFGGRGKGKGGFKGKKGGKGKSGNRSNRSYKGKSTGNKK